MTDQQLALARRAPRNAGARRASRRLARGRAIILLGAVLTCSTDAGAAKAEYLTPDLRERVEDLKQQVLERPTARDDASARAEVLWDWANAYSRHGILPVNLTAAVRPVLPGDEQPPQAALATLDAYVRELTFLDENPDGLGEVHADTGPFRARDRVTLRQTYFVGATPIETGGGILVARHFMPDYGRFQAERPAGDDYVSATSSNPSVRLAVDYAPVTGMHGGFRGAQDALVFRVQRGRLETDDTVTITYGDKSQGSRGFRMPTMSTDQLPLPLYVDLNGDGEFFTLPIQPVRVVGAAVAGVHGFAPSVVRPGERFALSVRAQDAYYNRATGPLPGWRVTVNGELLREIEPSDTPIHVLEDLRFTEPGVYRISIESADGAIHGRANPVLVSAAASRIYWGDTHGHSGFAEGIGTPDRFMTWAKEDARLDFVTHSEHDIWLDDREWQVLLDNARRYSEEGRFVAFPGYEWTTRNIYGGHHNVLFRDVRGRERVPTQFHPTLSALYQGLRNAHEPKDVLVIPHAHQAGDYRMSDPLLEPLVEIMSQHGTFEWFGRMYLNHGHQVGFIAASDNHLSQPGYTSPKGASLSQRGGLAAVMADAASRDALFDAMKSLRTYATTGERMILDVRLNDTGMGERAAFSRERHIVGRVVGTAPIDSIAVIRNDGELWRRDYLTDTQPGGGAEQTYQVSFESPSQPFHPGDNPRGGRVWRGVLEVAGARLAAFEGSDFVSPESNVLERLAEGSDAVRFATATRGDASSIRLRLLDVQADARIVVKLEEAREEGGAPPVYRPPATIPASEVVLPIDALHGGRLTHAVSVDGYPDTVTLRRVVTDGSNDVSFEVHDTGELHGDYYYVRVRQADDSMAWSSPIWVGGHSPR